MSSVRRTLIYSGGGGTRCSATSASVADAERAVCVQLPLDFRGLLLLLLKSESSSQPGFCTSALAASVAAAAAANDDKFAILQPALAVASTLSCKRETLVSVKKSVTASLHLPLSFSILSGSSRVLPKKFFAFAAAAAAVQAVPVNHCGKQLLAKADGERKTIHLEFQRFFATRIRVR